MMEWTHVDLVSGHPLEFWYSGEWLIKPMPSSSGKEVFPIYRSGRYVTYEDNLRDAQLMAQFIQEGSERETA